MSALSIVQLLGIQSITPDVETENAALYIHVPWVAPAAYLHTIYRPADPAELRSAVARLLIPPGWQGVLQKQNGSDLYSNSLYIYGVVKPGSLKIRDPAVRVPFSIEEFNEHRGFSPREEWLLIGSYGHSGSEALLSRVDDSVKVVNRSGERTLARWLNQDEWLTSELKRLSMLYTPDGLLRSNERFTDPLYAGRPI